MSKINILLRGNSYTIENKFNNHITSDAGIKKFIKQLKSTTGILSCRSSEHYRVITIITEKSITEDEFKDLIINTYNETVGADL
jgi:RNase P/RNase MRP subunit POP5